MRKHRRKILFACGAAALAAAAFLFVRGIQLTRLLERQAVLVFESSAAREAEAWIPRIEGALRSAEESALAALQNLPAAPSGEVLSRIAAAHPVVDTPFLIAADGSLAFPPLPGPALEALGSEDPPPEEYLRARRLALVPSREEEAAGALLAIASASEIAGPWRLRARACAASLQLRKGEAAKAAETYAAIRSDFPEALRGILRPSRAQLAACQGLALEAAGERARGLEILLQALRELEASGPGALGSDDAALLLEKAALLEAPRASGSADPAPELERFRASHLSARRSLEFARAAPEWILPRLLRGVPPKRFSEDLGGERCIVLWSAGKPGSWLAASGFRLSTERACRAMESAGGLAENAAGPLQVAWRPSPESFKALAALSGSLEGFQVGADVPAWKDLLGKARRPFRIASILMALLGLFLAASAGLGLLALRREMFLARMKTEFVANVSHELKTPLALIRLFGETLHLGRARDAEKAKEYSGIIARESERLTHLVNNILDFAGLEAGRKTFDLRPADLGRVVRETLAAYRFQLEERGFRLELSVEDGALETLADPDAVAQALINLINNAVKYSPERKEIAVRAARSGGAIRISVADRGIGIAPSERRRVFEDFYRSPAARSLGTRGSGLGLTLVRRILEAHGGSVELESKLGEGSTFTLVFPERRGGEKIDEKSGEGEPPAGDRKEQSS